VLVSRVPAAAAGSSSAVRHIAVPSPIRSFETLVSRLFRDSLQFCSGLVDLFVGVGHHIGGGHHFARAGERFVGLVAEDFAEVGDRGVDVAGGRGGEGTQCETGDDCRRFVAAEPIEVGGQHSQGGRIWMVLPESW
jgi:hypothetical protein